MSTQMPVVIKIGKHGLSRAFYSDDSLVGAGHCWHRLTSGFVLTRANTPPMFIGMCMTLWVFAFTNRLPLKCRCYRPSPRD